MSEVDSGGEKDSAFEADDVAQVQSSPKGHTEGCGEGCAVHVNILTHIQRLLQWRECEQAFACRGESLEGNVSLQK